MAIVISNLPDPTPEEAVIYVYKRQYDALRAEVEQRRAELAELDALRAEVADLQAECDQWQKKLTEDAWPENERLRAIEDAVRQMIELDEIDVTQPESYALVEALAKPKRA